MLLHVSVIVLAVYGGLLYLTYLGFTKVPTGFIPSQDKGYLLVDVRLPDSSSLERTQAVMAQVEKIARGARRRTRVMAERGSSHGRRNSRHRAHDHDLRANRFVQNAIGSNYGTCMSCSTNSIIDTAATWAPTRSRPSLRARLLPRSAGSSVAVFGAPPVDGLGKRRRLQSHGCE